MVQMAHRNRWFTELKNGGSFHGYVKLPEGTWIYWKKNVTYWTIISEKIRQLLPEKMEKKEHGHFFRARSTTKIASGQSEVHFLGPSLAWVYHHWGITTSLE